MDTVPRGEVGERDKEGLAIRWDYPRGSIQEETGSYGFSHTDTMNWYSEQQSLERSGRGARHCHRAGLSPQSRDAEMERERAHGLTPVDQRNGSIKSSGRPDMRSYRDRGQQQWTVIFLVALAMQPQVSRGPPIKRYSRPPFNPAGDF